MSVYVDKEYYYFLRGRELLLYKLMGSRNADRITQTGVLQAFDNELVYPDEDIANGLRIEYTRLSEPFVSESLETTTAYASGITISFSDSGYITSTPNTFWTSSGFNAGDKIRVKGSSSNDGDYTIVAIDAIGDGNRLEVSGSTLTAESAGERVTITQIPKEDSSPSTSSHINLNKMLSLAVVDYVKAMISEQRGEIDKKEYFMKEFYGKLADNESNKRVISMMFPMSPYAVR